MQWDCAYTVGWDTEAAATEHVLDIDLDLSLDEILPSGDAAAELAANEAQIRRQVFDLVVRDIVPRIVAGSGQDGALPKGRLRTNTRHQLKSDWAIREPQARQESPAIRSKMHIVFQIAADRPVNAMQALNGSKAGLASAVTDDIVFALQQKFHGVRRNDTRTEATTAEGNVVDYRARSKTDFQGN